MRVNVDWLSFYFDDASAPELAGDIYIKIDVETGVQETKRGFHVFTGSYDTTCAIRSLAGRVYFSGNPSRFGRGDNLFGYDLRGAYTRAQSILGLVRIKCPPFPTFTRVDLNTNFSFGSAVAAGQFMRHASSTKTSRQRQRAYDGDTVTYGEGSKYFYSKVYLKGIEMRRHAPGELADWVFAQGVVRYEAEYKSGYLSHLRASDFLSLEAVLMKDFDERVRSHMRPAEVMKGLDDLPTLVRSTFALWRQGYDPMSMLSRATFYRHRRELLNFGVDISVPASNVIQGNMPVSIVVVHPQPLEAPEGYELPPAHLIQLKRSNHK